MSVILLILGIYLSGVFLAIIGTAWINADKKNTDKAELWTTTFSWIAVFVIFVEIVQTPITAFYNFILRKFEKIRQ